MRYGKLWDNVGFLYHYTYKHPNNPPLMIDQLPVNKPSQPIYALLSGLLSARYDPWELHLSTNIFFHSEACIIMKPCYRFISYFLEPSIHYSMIR